MNPEEKNKPRGHEHSDWNLHWVVGGGLTLVICVAIFLTASWWIFRVFQRTAAGRQMGTISGPPVLPPEPRLQVSDTEDWTITIQREQAILHSYGWIDRSRGTIRIPIEREMELIAQRGFPATKPAGGATK